MGYIVAFDNMKQYYSHLNLMGGLQNVS